MKKATARILSPKVACAPLVSLASEFHEVLGASGVSSFESYDSSERTPKGAANIALPKLVAVCPTASREIAKDIQKSKGNSQKVLLDLLLTLVRFHPQPRSLGWGILTHSLLKSHDRSNHQRKREALGGDPHQLNGSDIFKPSGVRKNAA